MTVSSTVQVTAGRTVSAHDWNWGSGLTHSTTANPSYSYTTAGSKTVSLTATDSANEVSAVNSQTFTVPTTLPIATFSSSVNKTTVTFSAINSQSKFGTISTYAWDFGDLSAVQSFSIPTVNYTYTTGNSYTVTLTITDNKGAVGAYSSAVVTVNNVLPTATINVISIIGYTVNIEAIAGDSDGVVSSYEWDWGLVGSTTDYA